MNRIFSLVLLCIASNVFAANVHVYGLAKAYKGNTIVAFTQEDYFSHKRIALGTAVIDAEGNFDMNFDIEETMEVKLVISSVEAILYAEPGRTYHISMPAYMAASGIKRFNNTVVELQFFEITDNDPNVQVRAFNLDYAQFVKDHYYDFATDEYRGSEAYKATRGDELDKTDMGGKTREPEHATFGTGGPVNPASSGAWGSSVTEFKEYALEQYGKYMEENAFIHAVVTYDIASLELAGGKSKEDLFDAYLFSKPFLNHNPAFNDFFQMFHYNSLANDLNSVRKDAIIHAINAGKNWMELERIYENDPMLSLQNVRMMVLINGLKEVYHNRQLLKPNIEEVLLRMSNEIKDKKVARIAANVREALVKCRSGWAIEDVQLVDRNNEKWTLSSQEGKYVYILFYANWCTSCLKEMQMLEKINEQYGKDIQIVSISMDETFDLFESYVKEHPKQNWTFVYGAADPLIREKFNLRSMPMAYLITPDGRLLSDYTKKPTERVDIDFEGLKRRSATEGKQPGTWKD